MTKEYRSYLDIDLILIKNFLIVSVKNFLTVECFSVKIFLIVTLILLLKIIYSTSF